MNGFAARHSLRRQLVVFACGATIWSLSCGSLVGQDGPQVKRIWNHGEHNAFTDLIRFQDQFVCAFREANAHVPRDRDGDGKIRLIVSAAGQNWKSWHLIEKPSVDLRDPKISITPDGRLMVVAGGSFYDSGKLLKRIPYVSFYDPKTKTWTGPTSIVFANEVATKFDWLWRVTWHQGTGYGVIYQNNQKPWGLHLVTTRDGIRYQLQKSLELPGRPNETTIRFDKQDRMTLVVRNEDASIPGHIGTSPKPYQKWNWKQTDAKMGGPNFVFLPNGKMVLGARHYGGTATTILGDIQRDGSIRKFLTLPSGGDTSYPGMVVHDGKLFVSYYSSHEGKTNIYFYQRNLDSVIEMARQARKPADKKFGRVLIKHDSGGKLPYRFLKPAKLEKDRKYPLVIFLHGAGERGDDNKAQLVHGMNDFASREIMEKYPSFVFAPQCPKSRKWVEVDWGSDSHETPEQPSEPMKIILETLPKLIRDNPIDPDRIYVTGLSMGGYGTWDLISRQPDWFAAAVPICGGGDPRSEIIEKIKQIPVWVIHGDSDRAVKPKRSREMVAALKKAGAKPKLTIRKNTGHDSWTETYRDPAFYRWLYKQKRNANKPSLSR